MDKKIWSLLLLVSLLEVLSPATAGWIVSYDGPEGTIYSLAEYNGKLYAGSYPNGIIYVYDGASWTVAYDTPQTGIYSLAVYDNKLYAGTGPNGIIYVYDGNSWTTSYDAPGTSLVYSMAVYNGKLYAGTMSGNIYAYDGTSWNKSYNTPRNEDVHALAVYNGKLYAGTSYDSAVFTFDGASWKKSYDVPESTVYSLTAYDGKLYAGTGNNGIVYVYDGSSWTESYKTKEYYIFSLAVYDGRLYAGTGSKGRIYAYNGTSSVVGYELSEPDIRSLAVYNKLYAGTGPSNGVIYEFAMSTLAPTSAPTAVQTSTPTPTETPNHVTTPAQTPAPTPKKKCDDGCQNCHGCVSNWCAGEVCSGIQKETGGLFGKIIHLLRKLFGDLFLSKQLLTSVSKETAVETPSETVQKTQEPAATSKATAPIPTPSPAGTTSFRVKAREAVNPEFKKWTDNKISLEIPADWEVITYGDCATKSFIARDPKNPIRQVFYFSEAGPVYTSQEKKDFDVEYVSMGGYSIPYLDAPVVSPLNAQSFLLNFKALAETSFMRQIAPLAPKMTDIKVVSFQTPASKLLSSADSAELIRALFKQDGILGDGLFYIETYNFHQFNLGYGMSFIGISAGSGDFAAYEAALDRIINSYEMSNSYVSSCLQAQAKALAGTLKAGKTLSETSDMIMSAWENRQKTDDILSEKWSDAILGDERVYDSGTGDVYRVESGFYDKYNIHRENYEKNNLERLPDKSWELWTAPTLPQSDIR